jgi:tetratricopeptide (TPR) repeat protein
MIAGKSVTHRLMLRPRVIVLLLAFTTLLAYLPVTRDDFVNYDDGNYVTENSFVQNGLTWAGIKWAFTTWHASNWHPLTWLSHMTDWELFGPNPGGHHLVNILFHTANTILLFALLLQLTGKLWPCAFIAALFAWHPLHVESVAWISERKDVLSTFFGLLTLLAYANYAKRNCRRSFWFALGFFALGLMSKPMLVTLPFVMLLLDFWPLGRFNVQRPGFKIQKLFLEKMPFFALTLISCVVTFLAQRNDAVASLQKVPVGLRLENVLMSYADYLFKTIWPVHLAVFYPLPKHFNGFLLTLAIGVLIAFSLIAWLNRRQRPYLIVGWLWFLGTLVPVIGLVQVGDQAMADRYSYFPLIGIFIAVTFAAAELADTFQLSKIVLIVAGVGILFASLVLMENQLRYWRDSETLFSHALAVTKNNDLAHLNLGVALQLQGKSDQAMAHYREALRLNPQLYEADSNIAKLFYEMNKPEEAVDYCVRAIQLNPKRAALHTRLGLVLVKLNQFDEALEQFSQAAQLDVDDAEPRFQTGKTLLKLGRDAEAMPHFHEALKMDPNNFQMLIYVASILAADENPQIRNGNEALALAEKANQLTHNSQSVGLDTLAMALAETGNFNEAAQTETQAIPLAKKDDASLMEQKLQLYKNHQPYRESFR